MKRLGHIGRRCVWFAWEYKINDFWVGLFWDYKRANYFHDGFGDVVEDLHIWICAFPCFPLHFVMPWRCK